MYVLVSRESLITSSLRWQASAYCASGSPISAASTNKAAPLLWCAKVSKYNKVKQWLNNIKTEDHVKFFLSSFCCGGERKFTNATNLVHQGARKKRKCAKHSPIISSSFSLTQLYWHRGHGIWDAIWITNILLEYLSCLLQEPVQNAPSLSGMAGNTGKSVYVYS